MNHNSFVWAHTLFKNEERWLWFAVTSVINHVDKLLLWDTGSTDNSWKIATALKEKYKDKIDLRQYGEVTKETFAKARQAMLDETKSDWFLVVDGDEIWWDESIKKLTDQLCQGYVGSAEALIVPNINLIGDIYHYQDASSGNYKFGNLVGHYNLRAVKRDINGLHSLGQHGVWGWADNENKQIQDRNTFKFIDAPYLHATFIPRSKDKNNESKVPKRAKKLKYEIGLEFPKDFYYPESLFRERPDYIQSPWVTMDKRYKVIASLQTPFKKLKRKFIKSKIGY